MSSILVEVGFRDAKVDEINSLKVWADEHILRLQVIVDVACFVQSLKSPGQLDESLKQNYMVETASV